MAEGNFFDQNEGQPFQIITKDDSTGEEVVVESEGFKEAQQLAQDKEPEEEVVSEKEVEPDKVEEEEEVKKEDVPSEIEDKAKIPEKEEQQEERSPDLNEQVVERTNGQFKSFDELLEKATQPKEEPKFEDEFLQGLVDYYNQTGDVTPYLEAKTVDFEKMEVDDLLIRDLREQNPTLSKEAFARLVKREITSKLEIDPELEGEELEDAVLSKELLEAKAEKIRKESIDKQSKFKAPEPKEQKATQDAELVQKNWEKTVDANEEVAKVLSERQLTVPVSDVPEDSFHYPIDPKTVVGEIKDQSKFWSKFSKEDGSIDFGKVITVFSFADNPKKFVEEMVKHGKALGKEELIDKDLKNAKKNESTGSKTPTEQILSDKDALLKEAAKMAWA